MDKRARRKLRALLAELDTGERNRLMKRAAAMRKAAAREGRAGPRRPQLEEFLGELLGVERQPGTDRPGEGAGRSAGAGGEPAPGLVPGVVAGVARGSCRVRLGAGRDADAVLPRELAERQRSDIAVGDDVLLDVRGNHLTITAVLPRRTLLSRADPHLPARRRAIAANVDVVVVMVALQAPPLHPRLIDRYLVAVEHSGAEAVLVVNKVDLAAGGRDAALARLEPYRALGLRVLPCSATDGEGVDDVRGALAGRTCVVVGQSGVGKSSLLNALAGGAAAATGAVRAGDGRGHHTTTASTLYELSDGIRIIDTPGIRRFTIEESDPVVLAAGFAEFAAHAASCRFRDCTHTSEPGCAVRAAAESGAIARGRYLSYLKLLAGDGEDPVALAGEPV